MDILAPDSAGAGDATAAAAGASAAAATGGDPIAGLLGLSAAAASAMQPGGGGGGGNDEQQQRQQQQQLAAAAAAAAPHSVRPAIALVLEGRIGELLGVGPDSPPEHRCVRCESARQGMACVYFRDACCVVCTHVACMSRQHLPPPAPAPLQCPLAPLQVCIGFGFVWAGIYNPPPPHTHTHTSPSRSLFPLRGPVRAYPGLDPARPGLIRVEAASVYGAMGL